jgi:hypothetical protein
MTWAITIATFLGTVVAALLMLFVFYHRERILRTLREQRTEKRIPAEVSLELSSLDEPFSCETTPAENVSRHGARVVTKKAWRPDDHVLVKLPRDGERSRARIAYRQDLPGDSFAIGLQFSLAVHDWVETESSMSKDDFSSHLYRK